MSSNDEIPLRGLLRTTALVCLLMSPAIWLGCQDQTLAPWFLGVGVVLFLVTHEWRKPKSD